MYDKVRNPEQHQEPIVDGAAITQSWDETGGAEKGFMATEEGRHMPESRREFLRRAAAAGIVIAAEPGIASHAIGQSVPGNDRA